jgi:hypothetical protein
VKNANFIFDFETFGQDRFTCALVDCAYLIFDWDRFASDNPYTGKELLGMSETFKFELKDQLNNYGYKVEKDCIENFWMKLPADVRVHAEPSEVDRPLAEFIPTLTEHIGSLNIKKWWARGNDFDPIILRRVSEDLNQTDIYNKLKFWNLRDTRSFIDGFTMFGHSNSFVPIEDTTAWDKFFKKHVSRYDIMADVLRLQTIVRIKEGLE